MKERDELVMQIGHHVLNCFDKWTRDPQGKYLVVPNTIPMEGRVAQFDFPRLGDWWIQVTVEAPSLVVATGPDKYKHLNLQDALMLIHNLDDKR